MSSITTPSPSALESFRWTPQPEAENRIRTIVADFLSCNPQSAKLAGQMKDETGTRFIDWIDHIIVPQSRDIERELLAVGFKAESTDAGQPCYAHGGGIFPRILLGDDDITRIAIKVDSAADFLAVWQVPQSIVEGEPLSRLRQARIFDGDRTGLWIIERHGYRGFHPQRLKTGQTGAVLRHIEAFRRRQRDFENESDGFAHARRLIDSAEADLGVDWACDIFYAAEREFWQRRNRAAQVQKARQDRLGLGWANHDHHTYRSSREHFAAMIALFESQGFHCRERFYAGAEAGWGAQVLEQPQAGLVIFADVDLSPDELFNDFAHEPLAPRRQLGTVGLWCGLHGEAILQAGMHHLECQFDFESLRRQLEKAEIRTMKPFSDYTYLKQAFTEGERWPVSAERIERLLSRGQITMQQADQFREEGAIGSHLENLERNEGFKGFNQQGVNEIIAHTDPRLNPRK